MNKKLIFSLIILILVLVAGGIGAYQYFQNQPILQESGQQQNQDSNDSPQVEVVDPNIEFGGSGGGQLTICKDECGNGVCQMQAEAEACESGINCICAETPKECPVDCPDKNLE